MVNERAQARLAGLTYLAYIVFTMTSSILYGKATSGTDASQTLSALLGHLQVARLTVLLDFAQIICALVLAATLFRLTEPIDKTLSLLAMLFRVGEGLLGFLPLTTKLELMNLATRQGIGPQDTSRAAELLAKPDLGPSEFCFVVGGTIFAVLLLRGRLIPRWLAWIGVITIGAQTACVPMHIAGYLPGNVVEAMWMAIMLYEIPLGFWLIVKGVRSTTGMIQPVDV